MNDSTTFKKAPRRKSDKGRRVSLSPEAKQAMAEQFQKLQEQEQNYRRHLPQDENKRR